MPHLPRLCSCRLGSRRSARSGPCCMFETRRPVKRGLSPSLQPPETRVARRSGDEERERFGALYGVLAISAPLDPGDGTKQRLTFDSGVRAAAPNSHGYLDTGAVTSEPSTLSPVCHLHYDVRRRGAWLNVCLFSRPFSIQPRCNDTVTGCADVTSVWS